ncbi:hypothetical protein MIMGU_mgv1a025757mg [Erythranthe guttata]|uniref:Aluminum-activated malate transporter n=2 Tax=Erythranthe guttata TaxID=4155 RepID=A0A022QIL7_ERYGU|nr:hypothetical protein MIMGU_mgv1a025757mg [Erythranthe guttata]
MEARNLEKRLWLKGSGLLSTIHEIARLTTKVAKDDPRRLIHSLKFGLTISLVSFFYYLNPLYVTFRTSTMWAVLTVVVVFEFSVGATIGKGLNRGLATLVGGALGLGANHFASLFGKNYEPEPVFITLFVFLQAVVSTYIRFYPKVKARYDYGMLMFILTFCLISISGLRTDEIFDLAKERLSTILIGASTCVIVSIFVSPVWAGEDLHNLVAQNIEKLGSFLEGVMDESLRKSENEKLARASLNSVVVDSKSCEEALANFARWEPGHGRFMYRHPWKQYLKIGNLTRLCACRVEALNGYLITSIINQAPQEVHEALSRMSAQAGKALKELASSVETMTSSSYKINPQIASLKIASSNLKSILKSGLCEEYYKNLLQVIPVAALLIDTVASVEQIADAVNELSSMANFKRTDIINGVDGEPSNENNKNIEQNAIVDIPSVIIIIDEETDKVVSR